MSDSTAPGHVVCTCATEYATLPEWERELLAGASVCAHQSAPLTAHPTVAINDEFDQIARDWVADQLHYPTVAYRMPLPMVLSLIEGNYCGGMLAFLLEHPAQG